MVLTYNMYNQAEPAKMYISYPSQRIASPLNGIVSAKLTAHFNDIWQIEFEVDSLMEINNTVTPNTSYNLINQYMEIKVENFGWFRIDETPTVSYDDGRAYKSFTAYGYETTLQDVDINLFQVNTANDESIEMYEENLNALGNPKYNIRFYIPNANEDPTSDQYWKLGLLNILEHEYLCKKGWSIGEIDLELRGLRGRQFDIDSKTLYAFLTQDCATAYKCIFVFDRVNKTVNAYPVSRIGKDLNIEMSLRNVINTIEITDQNDVLYNCFRVSGSDAEQPLIEYVNYGSDRLYNFDYFIENGLIPAQTGEKYKVYKQWIEENRDNYANYSLRILEIDESISAIETQVPVDEIEVEYDNMTLEELNMELEAAQNVVQLLEEMNTKDGVLNIETSPDNAMYRSFVDVIIPKIQRVIDIRNADPSAPIPEKINWETNWELYGINELTLKKTGYEQSIDALKEGGYNKPWDETVSKDKAFFEAQYALYLEYTKYVSEIDERLNSLKQVIDGYNVTRNQISAERSELVALSKLENSRWNFTESEINLFNTLTVETDFSDSSIEILETDRLTDIIQLAKDLYKSADEQIQIESRPQLSFSIDIDNIFRIPEYASKANEIELGDFMYLELMDGYKTKQRLIKLDMELVDLNDVDVNVEFSDMVTVYGSADDYRYLLNSKSNASRKNSISKSSANEGYISSIASTVASQILQKYLGGSGDVFAGGISSGDLQKMVDALSGLIDGSLSLEELRTEIANIEHLEADSAFMKYLKSEIVVGDFAEFDTLKATVAEIQNLLAGHIGGEVAQFIHLTAENAKIDEAVIRDIIAASILVSDLKAGDITLTDSMRIVSDNGSMAMNGDTLQIFGTNSNGEKYVAIQLGYDGNNNPSLTIVNENGGIMLDGNGLHEDGIPDGTIKNNMIADGEIQKDKLGFQVVEPNEYGGIDITEIYDGNGGKFGVQYTTFKESTSKTLETLETKVEEVTPYRIEIESTNGNIFRRNRIETILKCHVFHGNVEVTAKYEPTAFHWSKKDDDGLIDEEWGQAHEGLGSQIVITRQDVWVRAIFNCTVDGVPITVENNNTI